MATFKYRSNPHLHRGDARAHTQRIAQTTFTQTLRQSAERRLAVRLRHSHRQYHAHLPAHLLRLACRRVVLRVCVLLARRQFRLQEGPLPQLHARDGQQQRLRHGYALAKWASPTLVQCCLQELLAVGGAVEGPGQREREVNQTAGVVRRVHCLLHHPLTGSAAIALMAHALALETLAVLAALCPSQRRVGQRPPQRTR